MTEIIKANKFYQNKKYEKAILHAKNLKTKKAYFILAESYFFLKKYKQAIPYYECLLKNNIKDPWLANHLSQSYEAIGDYKKATFNALLAIKLSPTDNAHHINFAYLMYEHTNPTAIKKWQSQYFNNPIVSHFASSLLGITKKEDSNIEYVKEIFDNFGQSFDDVLQSLAYKVPQYINNIIKKLKIKKANILDLGCGTGLCGKLIKKHAHKKGLIGVDISSKMLKEAYKKNIYHHLIEDDIISFLKTNKKQYNCIIASDVLTYFGNLEEVFSYVKTNLDYNGYFVFSISKNYEDSNNIFLHPSGRFLHSESYINKLIKNNNLNPLISQKKVLRYEDDKPVEGFIICAQKKP